MFVLIKTARLFTNIVSLLRGDNLFLRDFYQIFPFRLLFHIKIMLNRLIQKNRNYRKPITFLGLAILMASCAAPELPEESTAATSSSASEETIVAEGTAAPETPVVEATTATEVSTSTPTPDELKVDAKAPSSVDIDTVLKGFDQGTQYAVVRDRLIKEGWVPVEAPEPGEFGVEREAYDAGFTEVTACAGTGLGQCQFSFEHSGKQQGLSITTFGGSELQFGEWSIYSLSASTPADSSAITQEGRSEIPTQFQGEWNADLAGCGSLASDGRLVIEPNKLQFYESTAIPSQILVAGDLELTVTAEYSAEGDIFTETDSFLLSSDSKTLTHTQTDIVRYRCSS